MKTCVLILLICFKLCDCEKIKILKNSNSEDNFAIINNVPVENLNTFTLCFRLKQDFVVFDGEFVNVNDKY